MFQRAEFQFSIFLEVLKTPNNLSQVVYRRRNRDVMNIGFV